MLELLCRLLAKLPLHSVRRLGSLLGTLVYCASAPTRAVVCSNLAQAQLAIHPKAVIQANVRGLLEMVWVWFNPASRVAARCTVGDPALVAALHSGHPTILLTPHLGCFEALAKWVSQQAPLTAMYRRPTKRWLAALLDAARKTPQLTMASADASGVRLALKTLKSGGLLGILPDQVPKQGEGVWLPWFGREAYTITLPAKLQLATQARVFVLAALPTASGWRIESYPVNVPQNLSAVALTAHLNQALEHMVRRSPQHYAWSYKRYKGQP